MKREISEIWCSELRSGHYAQIQNYLSWNGNERCCLGVLCEVAKKQGIPVSENEMGGQLLPVSVVNWAGMSSDDGSGIVYGEKPGSLARLNDILGLPFAQIADEIEKQYRSL